MKIGMIGIGKLGLPVSVAIGAAGHQVIGYDKSAAIQKYIDVPSAYPYKEIGLPGDKFSESLKKYPPALRSSPAEVAAECNIIFVSVQTPHDEKYSGVYRIPQDRKDFDYSYLVSAVQELAPHLTSRHTLVIISTCMPGTIRREIMPLITGDDGCRKCRLVYNPFFIAMGTVIRDYLNPEFILIGVNPIDEYPVELVNFYAEMHRHRTDGNLIHFMSFESAELTKVAYNTFIGFKIALANTFGLLADRIPGADCDDVMYALSCANDRLISEKYLRPGMGDGGACHPRDLIAMSWLQNCYFLDNNPFDDVMRWREKHAEYLAYRLIASASRNGSLPIAVYGLSFKKNTAMLDGSHAILTVNILRENGIEPLLYDPVARVGEPAMVPHCILIGCQHDEFKNGPFPPGSIVIDPFRYIETDGSFQLQAFGIGSNSMQPFNTPPKLSDYQKHQAGVGGYTPAETTPAGD